MQMMLAPRLRTNATWSIFARSVTLSLALFTLVFSAGCGGLKRRGQVSQPILGPVDQEPVSEGEQTERELPRPLVREEVPKFGLILGPGGLKTLAHAGVLKELGRARIPIAAVIGLEWAALPAAFFSLKGEVNDVDWQLYKFEQKGWPESAWLSGSPKPASATAFASIFAAASGRIESAKIHFACPVRRVSTGRISWHQNGDFSKALNGCVRFPPTTETDDSWVAAPGAIHQALARVRAMGATRVIFVDVLGGRTLEEVAPKVATKDERYERLLWAEVRDALESARASVDEWIEVDTSGLDAFSLKRRKDLESRGETAARKRVASILAKYNL